nr:extracellular solute-binding protein [Sphaerisporangium cinnabarinum]
MATELTRRTFVVAAALGAAAVDVVARAGRSSAATSGTAGVRVLAVRHPWTDALRRDVGGFVGPGGAGASLTEVDTSPGGLLLQGAAEADVLMYRTLEEEDLLLTAGVLRPETAASLDAAPDAPPLVVAAAERSRLGVPVAHGAPSLFVHDDVLAELGDVRLDTFDDLYAAAYRLHVPGTRAGVVVSDEMSVLSPVLYSFGGAVAENGRSALGSTGSGAMFSYLGQLLRDCAAGEASLLSPDDAVAAFVAGGAALLVAEGDLEPAIRSRLGADAAAGLQRLPVPAGPDGRVVCDLPTWSLGVARNAADPATAQAFVAWATGRGAVPGDDGTGVPVASLATGAALEGPGVGADASRAADDDLTLVAGTTADAVRAPLAAAAAGADAGGAQQSSARLVDSLLGS